MDFQTTHHQAVTDKPGENALFIVYGLLDTPNTQERVKEVCTSFSAIVRSMKIRNY